jgi:hypothetical protein
LRLSADHDGSVVAARLCDVAPDGASTLVAMGASRIDGAGSVGVEVSMRATGYVVPAGHRLRLAITPGYWPMLWPSASITTLTIDRAHCTLDVPLVPEGAVVKTVVAPTPPTRGERHPPSRWSSQVFGSDEVRMERVTDSGVVTLEDGSWWRVGGSTTWSTDTDPLDSTTTTTATMERGRGEWQVRWSASSTMTADAECFHVTVDVSAFDPDQTVFERSYGYDIARDHG